MEKAGPITMHLHFKVLAILLISVAAVLMVGGCTTVPAGHVGIVVNNMGKERGVQSYTAKTGFFLYNPISTQVFVYPTSVQTVVWTRDTNEGKPIDESITFGTIEQIRQISAGIASAVEEQGAATQEIARNVHEAAQGTQEVSRNIGGVMEAASSTGAAAEQVLAAAGDLASNSERLRNEVGTFLGNVRTA